MIHRRSPRGGFTLAELIVVIAILGVMAAITGVAFARRQPVPVADTDLALLSAARDSAVRTGHLVTRQLEVSGEVHLVTAFPDGRVVSDASVAVSPLSGRKPGAQQ